VTTLLDTLARARRLVNGPRRELTTTVATTAVTAAAITVTCASTTGIAAQSIVEIGLEQMLVTAVASPTLTVARGYNGTLPSEHPVGSFVLVNPTLAMLDLLNAANAELNSLSSPQNGLFRVGWTDIASGIAKIGYDLDVADGFIDVLRVRYQRSTLGDWMRVTDWEIIRDADTAAFPSGVGIIFPRGLPGTLTTRVWYKTSFNSLSGDLAEDIPAHTGLPRTALDVLEVGTAIRAVEGREIARADPFTQGDTRRAQESPMGNNLQSTSVLRRSRDLRIAEEAARLAQQWSRA
jgi:hypothetical protein